MSAKNKTRKTRTKEEVRADLVKTFATKLASATEDAIKYAAEIQKNCQDAVNANFVASAMERLSRAMNERDATIRILSQVSGMAKHGNTDVEAMRELYRIAGIDLSDSQSTSRYHEADRAMKVYHMNEVIRDVIDWDLLAYADEKIWDDVAARANKIMVKKVY